MSLRKRNGKWHYRFKYKGLEYTGNTDLAAISQNMGPANEIEAEARKAIRTGRLPTAEIKVIAFRDAVKEFSEWAKAEYRAHPNSYKRIKTSLSSAEVKFNKLPVNAINAAQIDKYKTWRANIHEVEDVTIRHDLHALSVFFAYAIRHHWALTNPISEVKIPSDANAERIYVLTKKEEAEYFRRAARFPNLYDVGRVMINQGVRPEEATQIEKKHVNFENNKLFVYGKTKAAARYLDMTAETRQILERHMKGDSRWIFPSKRKRGSHIGRLNSAHDSIVAEAANDGVTINFVMYDMRHTFATRAAETNIDLATLIDFFFQFLEACIVPHVTRPSRPTRAEINIKAESLNSKFDSIVLQHAFDDPRTVQDVDLESEPQRQFILKRTSLLVFYKLIRNEEGFRMPPLGVRDFFDIRNRLLSPLLLRAKSKAPPLLCRRDWVRAFVPAHRDRLGHRVIL